MLLVLCKLNLLTAEAIRPLLELSCITLLGDLNIGKQLGSVTIFIV